jgi:hypothetical protein
MNLIKHECKERLEDQFLDKDGYGPAITEAPYYNYWISESSDGRKLAGWFIGNDEYGSRIRFCPYCGKDLLTIPTDT